MDVLIEAAGPQILAEPEVRPREQLRSILMSVSVCVSVCLSASISPDPHARSLAYQFFCMLPMAVARSSSGKVTKSQREGAILGVFLSFDNVL